MYLLIELEHGRTSITEPENLQGHNGEIWRLLLDAFNIYLTVSRAGIHLCFLRCMPGERSLSIGLLSSGNSLFHWKIYQNCRVGLIHQRIWTPRWPAHIRFGFPFALNIYYCQIHQL